MKFVLLFGVFLVTLFSYSSAEMLDDFDQADEDELLSLIEKEEARKDCIPKHHECTNNKHGCCRGHLFKYKCQCTTVVTQSGEETERCFCGTPPHHKAAELVVGFGKKIFG
uniref:U1-lycotoxin-Ls1kk n=1 Tax=Lycosa singoriensis TaxID=434756 RepID=TX153_LYCSI|nr:RecName: Full=U1-lycotoxin-Ls1kk; AltName: Full=Toxin-like structure LSTX-A53; Flags: Precursor [Lycosa singoriensis]ACI41308.1 toxin-like structure LSTX-A53 precursor [Lycosa singoriensis]CAS03578.1 toxin-like structure LSTX-A53 precursor [Lycosa singoriensis]